MKFVTICVSWTIIIGGTPVNEQVRQFTGADFYAADAVVLAPNAPIAKDAKSIRDVWASMLGPNSAVSWKVSKVEVAKSGDIGYVYGTYSMSVKDPKAPVNDTGKMAEIWKKQADGSWKCIVDAFNSDLPVPSPGPKK